MAMTRLLPVLLMLSMAARGEEPAVPEMASTAATPEIQAPSIEPPTLEEQPAIPSPANDETGVVEVRAVFVIDVEGLVKSVEITQTGGEAFDAALREAGPKFRFKPAKVNGVPTEVAVPYVHTFVPPAHWAPAEPTAEVFACLLEGILRERGTRAAVVDAGIAVKCGDREFFAAPGKQGEFSVPLPEGICEVRVTGASIKPFAQRERLVAKQALKVRYLVDRANYDPYELTITGTRERTEVSRTTLEGREISRVPGTFGDPFRVITLLPGVTSAMSLLPLPIVRGTSPGATGFFLDGVRLPLLFHLLGGPAVVHPEFIDRVDFHPGGFPVPYGGYTGGVVDGLTKHAPANANKIDLDLSLTQSGVFLQKSIEAIDTTFTAAGRIGYPGVLLSAITPDASLSYWDYQLRADGNLLGGKWTAFGYGANDVLEARDNGDGGTGDGKLQTIAAFRFHRADVRYVRGDDEARLGGRVVIGYDQTGLGTAATQDLLSFTPILKGELRLSPVLLGSAGLETSFRLATTKSSLDPSGGGGPGSVSTVTDEGWQQILSAWVQAEWRPAEGVVVVPGLRIDHYRQGGVDQTNGDPRISGRWKLPGEIAGAPTIKGSTGIFHQPPRLPIAVPGFDQPTLSLGLLAAIQTSAGVEWGLGPGLSLDVQGYYSHMDPVLFDLVVNESLAGAQQQAPSVPPGEMPPDPTSQEDLLSPVFQASRGRSYGFEFMLRKRDAAGLFGWIAYTLSKSERRTDELWHDFDFDRRHVLNVVAGLHLPRNWEVGGRLLLQTGTPLTTLYGYNAGRSRSQMRIDIRIDKRAVWNTWLLDFYVDIINSTVAEEAGGLVGGAGFRYLVPTVGFRAVL